MDTIDKANHSSATCLGTKCIRFSGTTKEALVAIFHLRHDNNTDANADADSGQTHSQQQEILRINVTDGVSVYQGEIDMDTVKMKLLHRNSLLANNKHKQATTLAGYLLQQEKSTTEGDDPVKPNYAIQDDGEKVKLVIKYYHGSDEDGSMKKAWSGILEKQQDTNDNNNDRKNGGQNANLSFFKILGDSINQGRNNVEILQSEKDQLQKDGGAWKDTAQKLEGTWQREKDMVFKNFSTLYNKTKNELDKALKEIRKLQDREQNMSMLALQNANKRPPPAILEEEEMPDQPDDYDHNLHDEEMVELLAAGKPYDIKSKKKSADKASTHKRAKLIKIKKEAVEEEEKKEPTFDDSDTSSDVGGGGKEGPAKHKFRREPDSSDDDDAHDSTRRAIL